MKQTVAKQLNIKNEYAVGLLNEIMLTTDLSKTDVVIKSLELYQKSLDANKRAADAIKFVEENIHPYINPQYLGKPPSKKEQEELLGM